MNILLLINKSKEHLFSALNMSIPSCHRDPKTPNLKMLVTIDYLNNLNNKDLNELFYLGSFPDPDILIRTGGYQRLSNFMLLNLSYSDLFFTNTLWPEFSIKELEKIFNKNNNIKKNYGL